MQKQLFDALIFDVDGVLVDVSESYFAVIQTSIQWAWGFTPGHRSDQMAFTHDHYRTTKRHPAFNDDYDIAWAFLCASLASKERDLSRAIPSVQTWEKLLENFKGTDLIGWVKNSFDEGINRLEVRRLCEDLYLGEKMCREILARTPRLSGLSGLWKVEKPLITRNWKEIPLPAGIYTGRPWPEMQLALKVLGWEDFPRNRIIVPEDGYAKPSPDGLGILCERMGRENPLFLGDTESDRSAFKAFGRGTFAAIGDILTDAPLRFDSAEKALEALLDRQ